MQNFSVNQVKSCSNCSLEARFVLDCCCKLCEPCAKLAISTKGLKGPCLSHENQRKIHDIEAFMKSHGLSDRDKGLSVAFIMGRVKGEATRAATAKQAVYRGMQFATQAEFMG